jgi:hypothetical protein
MPRTANAATRITRNREMKLLHNRNGVSGISRENFVRGVLLAVLIILLPHSFPLVPFAQALKDTRIEMHFSNDRPLRGEILTVIGRLSSTPDDLPIPLVTVHLQYYRVGETDVAREVSTITSNPSGLFQDIINTTYLLRIGSWNVNASFQSQLGYQSTSTVKTFTVVVQPALSLYLSTQEVPVGGQVGFNGLLFACIPCINDQITITLTRPDNTLTTLRLPLNATGGPYPAGYYHGHFSADTPGRWQVRAEWVGNDVTLPAYSQVAELNVESSSSLRWSGLLILTVAVIAVAVAAVVFVLLKRRRP